VFSTVVGYALLLGTATEVFGLWGIPSGLGFAFVGLAFGLAILGKAIVWYGNNSFVLLKYAAAIMAALALLFYVIVVLIPLHYFSLEQLAHYAELPRPGLSVILGGDEIKLHAAGRVTISGTICFYTSHDLAVGFAHKLDDGAPTNVVAVHLGRGLDATIVADTDGGSL